MEAAAAARGSGGGSSPRPRPTHAAGGGDENEGEGDDEEGAPDWLEGAAATAAATAAVATVERVDVGVQAVLPPMVPKPSALPRRARPTTASQPGTPPVPVGAASADPGGLSPDSAFAPCDVVLDLEPTYGGAHTASGGGLGGGLGGDFGGDFGGEGGAAEEWTDSGVVHPTTTSSSSAAAADAAAAAAAGDDWLGRPPPPQAGVGYFPPGAGYYTAGGDVGSYPPATDVYPGGLAALATAGRSTLLNRVVPMMKTAVATATPVVKRAAANAAATAQDAAERYAPVMQDAARRAATNAATAADQLLAADRSRAYHTPAAAAAAGAGAGTFWDSEDTQGGGNAAAGGNAPPPPQRLVDLMANQQQQQQQQQLMQQQQQQQGGGGGGIAPPSLPRPVLGGQEPPYEQAQKAAMRCFKAKQYEEAERLFRQALALCPTDDPQLAVVYNNLAATLEARLMPREAEALYLQAIGIGEQTLPPDHPRLKHIRSKLKALQSTLMPFPGLPKEVAAAHVAKTVALVAPAGDDFVSE